MDKSHCFFKSKLTTEDGITEFLYITTRNNELHTPHLMFSLHLKVHCVSPEVKTTSLGKEKKCKHIM